MPMPPVTPESFWARVNKSSDCWEWQGSLNTYGYGQVRLNQKQKLVHRVSWEWANGTTIPKGLWCLHRCDNRRCVRPDHLFIGTVQDNVDDMVLKGRGPKGSRNGLSKLTDQQVIEMRQRHQSGESFSAIARDYSITPENVSFICKRLTWRHL